MGPEDTDPFKVEPGRIWLVPVGDDGEPMGEPVDMSHPLPTDTFDWDVDEGPDLGLGGGLEGRLEGALTQKTWEFTIDLSPEAGESFAAALMGRTVEQYRDLVRWIREARWLDRLTGENWSRLE